MEEQSTTSNVLFDKESLRKAAANRNLYRKKVTLASALSAICYARNRCCNRLQLQMGLYLKMAKTRKRPLQVLHQMGVSVSSTSLKRAMQSVAHSEEKELKKFCLNYPAFIESLDNVNFHQKVRDVRLHHQPTMVHNTIAFVAINPLSPKMDMFSATAIDLSQLDNLNYEDVAPNELAHDHICLSIIAQNFKTLQKYADVKAYKKHGESLPPVRYGPIRQIPVQKSIIKCFPAYDLNEGVIEQLVKILLKMQEHTRYTPEQLIDKLILINGDQLSVRNSRYLPFFC